MPGQISPNIIASIQELRKKGRSLPEIQKAVGVGYGTVYRYIQGISIDPEYLDVWLGKRGGSIKRKKAAEQKAEEMAKKAVGRLDKKGALIFLSALYWGEGNKTDFSLINSDPYMIKICVTGLQHIFGIDQSRLRLSVRIYSGINQQTALKYWSQITGISTKNFGQCEVIHGKKIGKLPYGMCRVRVLRGGDLLKYIKAIYVTVAQSLLSP